MFNAAISEKGLPHYFSSDNDPLFRYHQWQANLRILGVDKIKIVPCIPTSHPFIERLIGNHVVERYVVNTLNVSSFGMLAISSENSKPSRNITINIGFINHWQERRRQLRVVTFNFNPQSSITIRGSHIATDCIKHKSIR